MSPSPLRRTGAAAVLLAALLFAAADAIVYWEDCLAEADFPKQWEGNYYNLCIKDETMEDRTHSWMFTKAYVEDTTFKNCIFQNEKSAPNNFTDAVWKNVKFDNCWFGSRDIKYGPLMVFDHTVMENVEFVHTTFDHSVDTIFDNFEMNNVTFRNCTFKGNTVFQSGTINTLQIYDSHAVHNPDNPIVTHNESIYFKSCTINTMKTISNQFINPVRFEGINAEDVSFNKSRFNELYCHGPVDKKGETTLRTQFNSSAFDNCEFFDKVTCDETSWRGFYGANLTFYDHADFSKSLIHDIYWDGIHSKVPEGSDIKTLNFSQSKLLRNTFANITVDGKASFEQTSFQKVRVKNFYAVQHNFDQAIFIDQEYIDGQCCSVACKPLKCRCNVTEPSSNCPVASCPVNVTCSEDSCFPGDARVTVGESGQVANIGELKIGDRIHIVKDQYSDVYFFGHKVSDTTSQFVRIAYDDSANMRRNKQQQQATVRLSPSHYLYVNGRLQTADSVRVGDRLRSANSGHDDAIVTGVDSVFAKGLYAPTTMHGDLAVDGVVVSSYTNAVHPQTAHRLLAPLRAAYRAGLRSLVAKMTLFERTSWSSVARIVGLSRGPTVMDEGEYH